MTWALAPGQRVLVVAPSSPADPARVARGTALLESWGLLVDCGASVSARSGHGHQHLSGDDEVRAADVLRGLQDPEIAAVVCVRGGSGCTRLLPAIASALVRRPPTPTVFVGSSDLTPLLAMLSEYPQVVPLFGPMIATLAVAGPQPDGDTVRALRRALMAGELPRLVGRPGDGEPMLGPLVGGTLTLLVAVLGTPFAVRVPPGAVLALEDVGEAPYRLDRHMASLAAAGLLRDLGAVALGSFLNCGSPAAVQAVLSDWLAPLHIPIVTEVPFGHGHRQGVLRIGGRVRIDPSDGSLNPLV